MIRLLFFIMLLVASPVVAQNYLPPPKHKPDDPSHWYHLYCCHLQDCAPITKWEKIEHGWIITIENGRRAILPEDFMTRGSITVKPSQDEKYHACIPVTMDESADKRGSIICVYVPLSG